MLLNGLAREDDQQLHRGVLDYHLALVANSGLTEDSFKTAQENARNAFSTYLDRCDRGRERRLPTGREERSRICGKHTSRSSATRRRRSSKLREQKS